MHYGISSTLCYGKYTKSQLESTGYLGFGLKLKVFLISLPSLGWVGTIFRLWTTIMYETMLSVSMWITANSQGLAEIIWQLAIGWLHLCKCSVRILNGLCRSFISSTSNHTTQPAVSSRGWERRGSSYGNQLSWKAVFLTYFTLCSAVPKSMKQICTVRRGQFGEDTCKTSNGWRVSG